MTPQEQIDHLEGEQNRLKEIMSQSDKAALHFIKTSDAFRAACPEIAAAYAAAVAEEAQTKEEINDEKQDWCFHIGEWRNAGEIIPYNGSKYQVLQGHYLSEEWKPDQTPALFSPYSDEPGDIDHPISYSTGMAIENGKYYKQYEVKYYCFRDSINPLYNDLSDLVGLYVNVVN